MKDDPEICERWMLDMVKYYPRLKWAMVKMAFNLSPNDLNKLEKEFGPLMTCPFLSGEVDVSVGSITASKHLEEGVDFSLQPKVDDTKEFHLVRCPKCELMVEELVATPYRHVCASCAKDSR